MEQPELHKRIRSLLRRHHLLSIATVSERGPWCASCFYSWDEENNTLVITTDPSTRHGAEFRSNPSVAGTIALETKRIGRIRGAQFTGTVTQPDGEELTRARKVYLRRFPFAALTEIHLWVIDLDFIKLTDNRLGFGKKITWPSSPTSRPDIEGVK
ncbi:MAG: pyridoxamine 5'-phosphate oxidase family protein [Bacteroidales bacterium]